jgi:hypothetical protein
MVFWVVCEIFGGTVMCRWACLALMLVVSVASKADGAIIEIDFNDPLEFGAGNKTFGDFTFTATNSLAAGIDSSSAVVGGNGSNAFVFNGGPLNVVTVNYTGTGTFTLVSLDLGRAITASAEPSFTITGSGPGVNVSGPFLALTTTSFGGAPFSNLSSLVISATQDAAFDNFKFTINAPAAVPEPASAAALCLGSLALVVRRMRRRNPVVA